MMGALLTRCLVAASVLLACTVSDAANRHGLEKSGQVQVDGIPDRAGLSNGLVSGDVRREVSPQEWLETARQKLTSTFSNLQFDSLEASEIPGLVEIVAGQSVLYYAPAQEILIVGEMYSSKGEALTRRKLSAHIAAKASNLDKDVALRIGSGSREVIAFVDPDCGYCKAAFRWLREQQFRDVQELIYFMPMPGRPRAEARALAALCAPEAQKLEALRIVFEGEAAGTPAAPCSAGERQLASHAEIARKIGVPATPFFLIDGEAVAGFDRERLTALLSGEKQVAIKGEGG